MKKRRRRTLNETKAKQIRELYINSFNPNIETEDHFIGRMTKKFYTTKTIVLKFLTSGEIL